MNLFIRLFGRELLAISTDTAEDWPEEAVETVVVTSSVASVDFGFAPAEVEYWGEE